MTRYFPNKPHITVKYEIIYVSHYFEHILFINMKELILGSKATRVNYPQSLILRNVKNERVTNTNYNANTKF